MTPRQSVSEKEKLQVPKQNALSIQQVEQTGKKELTFESRQNLEEER